MLALAYAKISCNIPYFSYALPTTAIFAYFTATNKLSVLATSSNATKPKTSFVVLFDFCHPSFLAVLKE